MQQQPQTFTDRLRIMFKGVLDAGGGFLNRLGLRPNTVTLLGLLGQVAGAYLIAVGQISLGGLVILVMAPIDALDGTMARLRGEPTKFGAFVDSVTDRYSEFVVMGGLLIYYVRQENWLACFLVYVAAAGSMLVPYIRSRAEGLGFEAKIGILSRVERYLVLIPALIINKPMWALWIIAVLTNVTALQRIQHVSQQAHSEMRSQQ